MRGRLVDVDVLYQPENATELAAGDRIWIVNPTLLHQHAASEGIVFSDRDLALIVGYGCRGRLTCAARVPRRRRLAAKLIERAATQERLALAERTLLAATAANVEAITRDPLWTLPVLDGHRADLGAILATVVDTAVAVARARSRIGPPSRDPHVAAAMEMVHTRLLERLAGAQAHVEALQRYASGIRSLASTLHTIEEVHRVDRADGPRSGTPTHMSRPGVSMPSVATDLAYLDRFAGDLNVLVASGVGSDIPPEYPNEGKFHSVEPDWSSVNRRILNSSGSAQ